MAALTQQLSVGVSRLLISILMDPTVSFQSTVFICLFMSLIVSFLSFFWHFAKKVVEHLMEGGGGGGSLTSCFSFDKLK